MFSVLTDVSYYKLTIVDKLNIDTELIKKIKDEIKTLYLKKWDSIDSIPEFMIDNHEIIICLISVPLKAVSLAVNLAKYIKNIELLYSGSAYSNQININWKVTKYMNYTYGLELIDLNNSEYYKIPMRILKIKNIPESDLCKIVKLIKYTIVNNLPKPLNINSSYVMIVPFTLDYFILLDGIKYECEVNYVSEFLPNMLTNNYVLYNTYSNYYGLKLMV